ncbi:LpxI family protein [Rhizobium helianthi]|uniref:LpxI family protein n=1 Tax=Rhizobium helianthi TaxID=1132695 RepID=A0ABW4LZW6_9HYPH
MESSDTSGRLAIIAGHGFLPLYVAEAARERGENPYIIVLKNEGNRDFSQFDHSFVGVGDALLIQSIIKKHGIARVVLSGGVHHRPEVSEIRPTFGALLRLPGILRTLISGGDDAVLRMVISLFESMGCKVYGVHQIAPNLLAEVGAINGSPLTEYDRRDIRVAAHAAKILGELDVGQGAICVGGRVVALEGVEGTDAMLMRVAELRAAGRISQRKKGVLVKLCKPQQDLRADLPTIGPATMRGAAAAGLAGIAVEAGRALVVEREECIAITQQEGLFLYGLDLAAKNMGLE